MFVVRERFKGRYDEFFLKGFKLKNLFLNEIKRILDYLYTPPLLGKASFAEKLPFFF